MASTRRLLDGDEAGDPADKKQLCGKGKKEEGERKEGVRKMMEGREKRGEASVNLEYAMGNQNPMSIL